MNILPPVFTVAVLALFAMPVHAKLNVVATTPDFAALASAIGGDRVTVSAIAKPTEDPHFVDARPSFIMKLAKADVLIEGGAELELGWLPPLTEGARNKNIAVGTPGRIRASDGITMLEIPGTLDRSQGDIHAAGNPHFLVDPVNALIVAGHFASAFAGIDPAGADAYQANLRQFTERLNAKLTAWQAKLAPFQGRGVVSYHNTWPYFARRFGLKFELFLEPKPGVPPTPGHLVEVIQRMKAGGVNAILVEPFQSRQTAAKVAGETGATVVEVTQYPGGVKGTEAGYIEMIDQMVEGLAKALTADGGGRP